MVWDCNISLSPITLVGKTLHFGIANYSLSDSTIVISGNSCHHSVAIRYSNVTLHFADLLITTDAPVVIEGSSVVLLGSGLNRFESFSAIHSGVECSSGSNVTLMSVDFGHYFVLGGEDSSGIGSNGNGNCESIVLKNVSMEVSGGTGIGSGLGISGGLSRVGNVFISDCVVRSSGSFGGSGIGSGRSKEGFSIVENMTIARSQIIACSLSSGSGIGSGQAGMNGSSVVRKIVISDSIAETSSFSFASGMGSGFGESGNSSVENVLIVNSKVKSRRLSFGSGIGSGFSVLSGCSVLDEISILNCTIDSNGSSGCGVGPGP
jgi:hypothetical protein